MEIFFFLYEMSLLLTIKLALTLPSSITAVIINKGFFSLLKQGKLSNR